MLGHSFIKVRPDWLPGENGRSLELDGYSEALNAAFEYHGPHHYGDDKRFDPEAVAAQQRRDEMKVKMCRERGVRLIVVPPFPDSRDSGACIDQIEYSVLWAGLTIPKAWKRPKDLPELHEPLERVFGRSRLAKVRQMAAERGGELASKIAKRADDELTWQCAIGHRWDASIHIILRGHWCKPCADADRGRKRRDPNGWQKLQAAISARGGEFLGPEFESLGMNYNLRCAKGHEWPGRGDGIVAGKWCPECGEVDRALSMKAAWDRRIPHGSARRDAVLQLWESGLSQSEIARQLSLPHGSVGTIIHRARSKGDVRAVRRQPPKSTKPTTQESPHA